MGGAQPHAAVGVAAAAEELLGTAAESGDMSEAECMDITEPLDSNRCVSVTGFDLESVGGRAEADEAVAEAEVEAEVEVEVASAKYGCKQAGRPWRTYDGQRHCSKYSKLTGFSRQC